MRKVVARSHYLFWYAELPAMPKTLGDAISQMCDASIQVEQYFGWIRSRVEEIYDSSDFLYAFLQVYQQRDGYDFLTHRFFRFMSLEQSSLRGSDANHSDVFGMTPQELEAFLCQILRVFFDENKEVAMQVLSKVVIERDAVLKQFVDSLGPDDAWVLELVRGSSQELEEKIHSISEQKPSIYK